MDDSNLPTGVSDRPSTQSERKTRSKLDRVKALRERGEVHTQGPFRLPFQATTMSFLYDLDTLLDLEQERSKGSVILLLSEDRQEEGLSVLSLNKQQFLTRKANDSQTDQPSIRTLAESLPEPRVGEVGRRKYGMDPLCSKEWLKRIMADVKELVVSTSDIHTSERFAESSDVRYRLPNQLDVPYCSEEVSDTETNAIQTHQLEPVKYL